jgi:copper chaperone CopZ
MSRKRGEFEHRTSIFEGAFRAWSHLGGLDLADLQNKSFSDLDPLNHPIEDDSRLKDKSYGERGRNQTGADPPVDGKEGAKAMEDMDSVTIDSSNFSSSMSQSGSKPHQRVYPYEPLPRTGTSHPFVKAIISPWLGDNATGEQKQLGLTTLRTWWQHRRKGESVSAIKELGTDKMRVVVEGYTRWFFQYAHNCVTQGMEHPPRTLATKIKEAEKRSGTKIMFRMEEDTLKSLKVKDLLDLNKKPKENIACCSSSRRRGQENSPSNWPVQQSDLSPQYGDPNKTPVVFISANGDIQIALKVKGITCGNCVKIIETVLKGVNGRKTPIPGLVDAAADRELSSVLIKLEKGSDARRVAFEAGNNLIKVGYESQAIEMGVNDSAGRKTVDMNMLVGAFAIVANTDARDVFDWSLPCTCPDNGVVREDCPRYVFFSAQIFII